MGATYSYLALDGHGARSSGEVVADSAEAVGETLRERGLVPLSVELRRAAWNVEITLFERVRTRDMVVFSRQFATMIGSGLTVLRSLAVLEEQSERRPLRETVARVRKDVEGGAALSDALAAHPRVFSRLYVAMVHAGEIGGVLEEALRRAADQLEKDAQLRRAVRSALVYPAVVIAFALAVLLALVAFLVPVFVGVLEENGSELPAITRVTVALSDLVTGWWWAVLPVLVALGLGVHRATRTARGRRVRDRLALRLPLRIGEIVRKVAMARWARTLSTLVAAGVPLLQAVEITGRTAGNVLVEDAMDDVAESVRRGGSLQAPLRASAVFPPMAAHMVGVGEETGALDDLLGRLAGFYEDEVQAAVKALTSILEPVLIVVVGGIVGFIVVSMYLPLFSLYDSIR